MAPKTILITGATGKQGGAVVQALLAHPPPFDFKILALTRNTSSKAAQALTSDPKVELLAGDLNNCPEIFEKAGGVNAVWGAFLVTLPSLGKKGVKDMEVQHGTNFIDAAMANHVQHLIFSSVDRGGPEASDASPTEIAHFATKFQIEQHLKDKTRGTDTTWTILRTVAFMENLTPDFFGKIFAVWWSNMGDSRLQLLSTKDIGIFVALSFAAPESKEYHNVAISLAGDQLSYAEGKEVFSKVKARSMPITFGFLGTFVQWMMPELGTMFQWFKDEGCKADIQKCRTMNVGQLNFETWLKEESKFLK